MNFDEINKRLELCRKLEKESSPTLRSIYRSTNDTEIKTFISDLLASRKVDDDKWKAFDSKSSEEVQRLLGNNQWGELFEQQNEDMSGAAQVDNWQYYTSKDLD